MANNPNDGYAGVIAALADVTEASGGQAQSYPPNWDGIIRAIRNLGDVGDANTGENPPGWEIITDNDGNVVDGNWKPGERPGNGDLWFDQRQGRLMVFLNGEYYQTNGADVLTVVGPDQPSQEVVGALWYNPDAKSLFIYDGTSWVTVSTTVFSTETLQLSTLNRAETASANNQLTFVPEYSPGADQYNQNTLNRWAIQGLLELDKQAKTLTDRPQIHYGNSEPQNDVNDGDLWANTNAKDLRVRIDGAWEFVFDNAVLTNLIANINHERGVETFVNNTRFENIESSIQNLPFADYLQTTTFNTTTAGIESDITDLTAAVGDVTRFALNSETDAKFGSLTTRVSNLESKPGPDLSHYSTTAETLSAVNGLEDKILDYHYSPISYVDSQIRALDIPDVSNKVDTTIFNTFVSDVNSSFLKKLGGTINGTVSFINSDPSTSKLDFTGSSHMGTKALAFKPKSCTKSTFFGTTDNAYELAWNFESLEQFNWNYQTNKVFGIDKDGVTTSKLKVGNVDIGAKLTQLAAQITVLQSNSTGGLSSVFDPSGLEAAIAALQAQICQHRIHYSDSAPTVANDGDLWFNSTALKLYVRHSNAWLNPDRVEDESDACPIDTAHDHCELQSQIDTLKATVAALPAVPDTTALQAQVQALSNTVAEIGGNDLNLKADLYNAISTSTSFIDLKSKLMSALSG